jgi:hypothetical protein
MIASISARILARIGPQAVTGYAAYFYLPLDTLGGSSTARAVLPDTRASARSLAIVLGTVWASLSSSPISRLRAAA